MKAVSPFIIICLLFNISSPVHAEILSLPKPGTMVFLSKSFNPPLLKGVKVNPNNPFEMEFVVSQGDTNKPISKDEANLLVKYFLSGMTTPKGDLWVNLSPYEKDRIVADGFGSTQMGRDLLAQDYLLKQITASLIYPEDEIGKKFWKEVYGKAANKQVAVNTFNKVWIVPDKAVVYENPNNDAAFVVSASLKVLTETDYIAVDKNQMATRGHVSRETCPQAGCQGNKGLNAKATEGNNPTQNIIKNIIIPQLEREVNEGKNFASLRQIYSALILAAWYKKKLKNSILNQTYSNQNKTAGITFTDDQGKEKIYAAYLQAFKKGAYNYIKEDIDPATHQSTPRKYFSGGAAFGEIDTAMEVTTDRAMSAREAFGLFNKLRVVLGLINGSASLQAESINAKRRSLVASVASFTAVGGSMGLLLAGDSPRVEKYFVGIQGVQPSVQQELANILYPDDRGRVQVTRSNQQILIERTNQINASGIINNTKEALAKSFFPALIKHPDAVIVTVNNGPDNLIPIPIDRGKAEARYALVEKSAREIFAPMNLSEYDMKVSIAPLQFALADPLMVAYDMNPDAVKDRKTMNIRVPEEIMGDYNKVAELVMKRLEGVKFPTVVLTGNAVVSSIQALNASNATAPASAQQIEISAKKERRVILSESPLFSYKTTAVLRSALDLLTQNIGSRPVDALPQKKIELITLIEKQGGLGELEEFETAMKVAAQTVRDNPNANILFPLSKADPGFGEPNKQLMIWANCDVAVQRIFDSSVRVPNEDALRDVAVRLFRAAYASPWGYLQLTQKFVLNDRVIRITKVVPAGNERDAIGEVNGNLNVFRNNTTRSPLKNKINALVEIADAATSKNKLNRARLKHKAVLEEIEKAGKAPGSIFKHFVPDFNKALDELVEIRESYGVQMAKESVDATLPNKHFPEGSDVIVMLPSVAVSSTGHFLFQKHGIEAIINNGSGKYTNLIDRAQATNNLGGIDLNNIDPASTANSGRMQFNITPQMLKDSQNAKGLAPVVLTISPLASLNEFLK